MTNSSKASKATLIKHLRRAGLSADVVKEEHVITSAIATFQHLKNNDLNPLALIDPSLLKEDYTEGENIDIGIVDIASTSTVEI